MPLFGRCFLPGGFSGWRFFGGLGSSGGCVASFLTFWRRGLFLVRDDFGALLSLAFGAASGFRWSMS